MNLLTSLKQLFTGDRPQNAFVMDDADAGTGKIAESIFSDNVTVDEFNDSQKLLFALYTKPKRKYQIGIIHENGSKYKPQILCEFIKQIDPNIRLIICKDATQLQSLVLT